jgi:hypothetical protein
MSRAARSVHSRNRRARAVQAQQLSSSIRFFPDASSRTAAQAGASVVSGGAGRAHQEGQLFLISQAFTFAPSQPVQGLFFTKEAPLVQTHLPLLGRIDAPSVVPPSILKTIKTYRAAVRLCWALRRAKGLKPTDLGREFGFTRQHVSDYLNTDDKPTRRDLPAERIADFEDVCGNSAISQWLAQRAKFTVLEELQAERAAA